MKRVFIIHGWEGHPGDGWYPLIKQELEKRGFSVFVPLMPNSAEPEIESWVSFIENLVDKPDEQTYFIGHSIGCQAILRYLEKLSNKKIGGAVFVAGWFHLTPEAMPDEESKMIAKPWIETPINFERVKQTTDKFVAVFSDNDPCVPLTEKDIFQEKLNAKIIIEESKGHFDEDSGIKEVKSVLDSILDLAKF